MEMIPAPEPDRLPDEEAGKPVLQEGPMPRHVWEARAPPRWRLFGMHPEEDKILVHRAAVRMEGIRLLVQFYLVMAFLLLCLGLALKFYLQETSLLHVPTRCWEDTFGPFKRIWDLEPPTLERRRFEEPSNLWHPLTFAASGWVGRCQDVAFSCWNWTFTALFKGPWYLRPVALFILLCCALPFTFVYGGPWENRWCCEKYLLYMPERLLILHQLKVAHEIFGRKLSPEAIAELEHFMEWKNAHL